MVLYLVIFLSLHPATVWTPRLVYVEIPFCTAQHRLRKHFLKKSLHISHYISEKQNLSAHAPSWKKQAKSWQLVGSEYVFYFSVIHSAHSPLRKHIARKMEHINADNLRKVMPFINKEWSTLPKMKVISSKMPSVQPICTITQEQYEENRWKERERNDKIPCSALDLYCVATSAVSWSTSHNCGFFPEDSPHSRNSNSYWLSKLHLFNPKESVASSHLYKWRQICSVDEPVVKAPRHGGLELQGSNHLLQDTGQVDCSSKHWYWKGF